MRKYAGICAALIIVSGSSVMANEQEASIRRLEVPGASFDLILATPKSPPTTIDLGESPDALVIHLVGGELALAFESFEAMLDAMYSVRSPIGASHVHDRRNPGTQPIAVYVVPKTFGLKAAASR